VNHIDCESYRSVDQGDAATGDYVTSIYAGRLTLDSCIFSGCELFFKLHRTERLLKAKLDSQTASSAALLQPRLWSPKAAERPIRALGSTQDVPVQQVHTTALLGPEHGVRYLISRHLLVSARRWTGNQTVSLSFHFACRGKGKSQARADELGWNVRPRRQYLVENRQDEADFE
jgi:hypothetical protein